MGIGGDIGKQAASVAPRFAPELATSYLDRVTELAINGIGSFKGARHTAGRALEKQGNVEHAIGKVARRHLALAGVQGFITNLGGLVTLPIAIPANISGAAILQARLAASIAHLRGYDIDDPRVRSAIIMTLLGEGNANAMIASGELPATPLTVATAPVFDQNMHRSISEKVMGGMLAQVTGKRITILGLKRIPLIGGGVGATTDGATTWAVATYARSQFASRRDPSH